MKNFKIIPNLISVSLLTGILLPQISTAQPGCRIKIGAPAGISMVAPPLGRGFQEETESRLVHRYHMKIVDGIKKKGYNFVPQSEPSDLVLYYAIWIGDGYPWLGATAPDLCKNRTCDWVSVIGGSIGIQVGATLVDLATHDRLYREGRARIQSRFFSRDIRLISAINDMVRQIEPCPY